jgi:hypothetical protein
LKKKKKKKKHQNDIVFIGFPQNENIKNRVSSYLGLTSDSFSSSDHVVTNFASLSLYFVPHCLCGSPASVTDQQTCYDGHEDSKTSIVSSLSKPLNNVTKLYSVSLWVGDTCIGSKFETEQKEKGVQRWIFNNTLPKKRELLTVFL